MDNVNLSLQLTTAEINLILGNLGAMPYNQVSGLINKIKAQAEPQLQAVVAEEQQRAAAEQAVQQQG